MAAPDFGMDVLQGSAKHVLHPSNANSTAPVCFKPRITELQLRAFFLNPSQNASYAQGRVQPACAVGWLAVGNREFDNHAWYVEAWLLLGKDESYPASAAEKVAGCAEVGTRPAEQKQRSLAQH